MRRPLSSEDTLAYQALLKANRALGLASATTAALKQQPWFIDPQNSSGKASDGNDGAAVTSPLLTYGELINRRWGSSSPAINGVAVTITQMSSGLLDGSDPVALSPVVNDGGSFVLTGVPKAVATGTFTGVVAQNRNTGQLTNAAVVGPLPANWWSQWLGMLVNDTTTGAWFWVDADLGAKTAQLTRPKTSSLTSVASALSTISNGDAFVIYQLPTIDLVRVAPNFDTGGAGLQCQIQHLSLATPAAFAQPQTTHIESDSTFVECSLVGREPVIYSGACILANCYSGGPFMLYGAGFCGAISGAISVGDEHCVVQGGTLLLDGDVYCEDHVLVSNAQVIAGLVYYTSIDAPPGTLKVPSSQFGAGAGGSLVVTPCFYGSAAFWGPGIISCAAGGDVVYSGTATSVFLNAGGLLLDGAATASSYDGAGTWHGGIALNPTSLDAAAGAAGFGGCAYGNKGSKIRQWA
jgi:hypothetical protein